MNIRIILAFLLLGVAVCSLAQNFTPMEIAKPKIHVDESAPACPLVSPDEGRDLGRLLKFEVFPFKITVENPTDEDIRYTRVAINCTCTTFKLSPSGVVPAHGKLVIPMMMDANKARGTGRAERRLVMECEGYQPFVVNFYTTLSTELNMVSESEDTGNLMQYSSFPVGYVPGYFTDWERTIELRAAFEDPDEVLELGDPVENKEFTCKIFPGEQKNWFTLVLKPKLPQRYGEIRSFVIIPILKSKSNRKRDILAIQIMGVVGSRMETSLEDEYAVVELDENGEARPCVFELARYPFIDGFAARQMLNKQPNPYSRFISPLRNEELMLPQTAGIRFEVKQLEMGVVEVTMFVDTKQVALPPEGLNLEFQAPDTRAATVTVVDSAQYKRLKEAEAAEEAAEAEDEDDGEEAEE